MKEKMRELDGKVSLYDQSLFIWHEDEQLVDLVVIHVDDFTFCGTSRWHDCVVGEVMK